MVLVLRYGLLCCLLLISLRLLVVAGCVDRFALSVVLLLLFCLRGEFCLLVV